MKQPNKKENIMKRTFISSLTLIVFLTASSVFAQRPGFGTDRQMGPRFQQFQQSTYLNLTTEQQTQIDKLRLKHQKEVTLMRDEVRSLNTAYRLMIIDDGVSEAKLKKHITSISAKRETLALKRAQHQRQVRSLLTDEQKVKFDQHVISGRGQRGHKGHRSGMNQNYGRPMGRRAR